MAKTFTIDIQGLDKVLKRFNQAPENLKREVQREIRAGAEQINRKQQRLVPVDEGRIKLGLSINKVSESEYELVSSAFYSPYEEFGTKAKAIVPTELAEFAAQFKGGIGGDFAELLKSITGWVNRKGIDKKAAFPIARSIALFGIPPHPFFFPPFFSERQKIIDNIQNVLKDL